MTTVLEFYSLWKNLTDSYISMKILKRFFAILLGAFGRAFKNWVYFTKFFVHWNIKIY